MKDYRNIINFTSMVKISQGISKFEMELHDLQGDDLKIASS